MGQKINVLFTNTVMVKPPPGGAKLVPGWVSWSCTIIYGRTVGATPDGRHSGESINHYANPIPGFRKNAAVTALSSIVADVQCGYTILFRYNWISIPV